MAEIDGKIRVLKLKRPGETTFKQVGFLLVNAWSRQTSFLPTTTPNDEGYKTEVPVEKSGTVTFSALVFEDADYVDRMSYKELMEIDTNNELVEWLLIAEGKNLANRGKGHFSATNEQAPNDGFVQVDVTMNMFGRDYQYIDTEPPSQPVLTLAYDELKPSIQLSWTMATDNMAVEYYEVRRLDGKVETIVNVGDVLAYEDLSVSYFRYYGYNVRAVDVNGNVGGWSNKQLGYIPLPPSQPTPNYKMYQNGIQKQYQNGTIKTYQ